MTKRESPIMVTRSLRAEYLKKLFMEMHKLDVKMQIFETKVEKSGGLAKAKYLEQVKNIKKRQDYISNNVKKIMKEKSKLSKNELDNEVGKLLKDISELTEAKKNELTGLLK